MSHPLGDVCGGTGAPPVVAAVVLAGGQARRFGSDKLAARIHGSILLERSIAQIPRSWRLIVVGPPRNLSRPHIVTFEDPPGGGPAAGLVAGARAAQRVGATTLVALPGDAPEGGAAAVVLVRALHQQRRDWEAGRCRQQTGTPPASTGSAAVPPAVYDQTAEVSVVVAVDDEQYEQPLHVAVAGAALDRLAAVDDASGRGARRLLRCLGDYRTVRLPPRLLADLDTAEQAAAWKPQA